MTEASTREEPGKEEIRQLPDRTEIVDVVMHVAALADARDWRKEARAVSTEGPTNVMPLVDPARRAEVRFESEGLQLAGHLYRARGVLEGGRAPALVMAGPMTSVKEETLPHYAERLQDAGYTVLAFDNRNFGESEGEPRQHLDTYEQVEDLKNAISYVLTREDVDPERLGLCCVCLGAGYGLEVAAMDRRVNAVALVAGGYNITDTYLGFLGPDGFRDYIENLGEARQSQHESGEIQYMPAVAGPPDYAPSAMPVEEAYEYYTRAHKREAPNWENRLTVASMEHIVGWNVLGHAHLLEQPLLIVHGTTDVLLPPRYALEVYERAPEPKEIFWVETHNHVELYDQEPYVPQALEKILPWLEDNLKGHVPDGDSA
ncbi:MAG: alpha/beta hydrolase [Rubrobacteraceae bacterium]|nr:alpha/beta hydrolase [Rubrobacteraceae bacterium]